MDFRRLTTYKLGINKKSSLDGGDVKFSCSGSRVLTGKRLETTTSKYGIGIKSINENPTGLPVGQVSIKFFKSTSSLKNNIKPKVSSVIIGNETFIKRLKISIGFEENKHSNERTLYDPSKIMDEPKHEPNENKKDYIKKLAAYFNEKFFDNKLDLNIEFGNILKQKRIGYYDNMKRTICLDVKEGLTRTTLLHEMCHAAQHQINGEAFTDITVGHTHTWRMWMKKVGLNPKLFDGSPDIKNRRPLRIDKLKVCYPFVKWEDEKNSYGYISKILDGIYVVMELFYSSINEKSKNMTVIPSLIDESTFSKSKFKVPQKLEVAYIKKNFEWDSISNISLDWCNYDGNWKKIENAINSIKKKDIKDLIEIPNI